MKKIFLMTVAAILSFCGVTTVLTSCDDDEVENVMETLNIVGKWKTTAEVRPTPVEGVDSWFIDYIEFKADGTVVAFEDGDSDIVGTWILRDKTLIITMSIGDESFNNEYKIQEGWTRDRMVITYSFTEEDEDLRKMTYNVTITLNRVK